MDLVKWWFIRFQKSCIFDSCRGFTAQSWVGGRNMTIVTVIMKKHMHFSYFWRKLLHISVLIKIFKWQEQFETGTSTSTWWLLINSHQRFKLTRPTHSHVREATPVHIWVSDFFHLMCTLLTLIQLRQERNWIYIFVIPKIGMCKIKIPKL